MSDLPEYMPDHLPDYLPEEFHQRLARVIKLVRTQRTLPSKLEAVVELAKRTVPNCDAAGVSLVVVGEPLTSAATDPVVLEVDLVQYATGQGPCVQAMATSRVVRVDVIERDIRYRRLAPGALDAGINSIVSFPLVAARRTVGALNLYSGREHAFDEGAERDAAPLVGYASDVLATSPLYAYSLDVVDGLLEAMDDRAAIERATGVLLARRDLTRAEAFAILREDALRRGVSLRQAAGAVLASLAQDGSAGDRARRPPPPP